MQSEKTETNGRVAKVKVTKEFTNGRLSKEITETEYTYADSPETTTTDQTEKDSNLNI